MFKYKIVMLVVILLSFICINKTYSYFVDELFLAGKTFYIDPGHGGVDPGAVYKDIKESDINLMFAKKIGEYIEKFGGTVYYTREGDYDLSSTKTGRKKSDLSNRIKLLNDSDATMYLSIHVNSEVSSSWYGAQVFYTVENSNNMQIANSIQDSLNNNKFSKRKVSIIKDTYMYDRIKIPGILIEVGFLSNYSDRIKLQDENYAAEFSKIIVNGLIDYFK